MYYKVYFSFFRGEEFRKDFIDLSVSKAFFPNVPTMALTATAPPHLLRDLKQRLRLKNECKIVEQNPNRVNRYPNKKVCLSKHHGNEGYDRILGPIAHELTIQRENYPMTIVYLKLKNCGNAYGSFEEYWETSSMLEKLQNPLQDCLLNFMPPRQVASRKIYYQE